MLAAFLYIPLEIITLICTLKYLPKLIPEKLVNHRAMDICLGILLAFGVYVILATTLFAISRLEVYL